MHTLPNLPASAAREVFATLCALLPPPVTDSAEARAAREETAMAAVAALHPADAFEADLAAQIVGADAHAKESLRLAVQPGQQPEQVHRCRAQAANMMRQMLGMLRALERMQAKREKAEATAHPAAMEAAGDRFRDASVPPPTDRGQAKPATADSRTEAERYAARYPDRAARIRAHGGLPDRFEFALPAPEIVAALVSGTAAPVA